MKPYQAYLGYLGLFTDPSKNKIKCMNLKENESFRRAARSPSLVHKNF